MNVVIFNLMIIVSIVIGSSGGIFLGDWLINKYRKRRGYVLVKKEALMQLAEERNVYRFALENDISLDMAEEAMEKVREARA